MAATRGGLAAVEELEDPPGDVEQHGDRDSLFEQLAAEAVPPWLLQLPDGADQITWEVDAPTSDGVCELDELDHPADVLVALLGDDIGDQVLDVLEPLPWPRTVATVRSLREHFALEQLPRGLWQHLVEQIDLYGEAIESDLAERSIDLLDFFRGVRPWPQLARLLPRLPIGSRYAAAILDDEDLARERLQADEDSPRRPRPPLDGETPERALLRGILSVLLRVEHATYAVHAGKKAGSPPKPLPGPETAEDRLRAAIDAANVEDIFDAATPGWRDVDADGFHPTGSGLLVPD